MLLEIEPDTFKSEMLISPTEGLQHFTPVHGEHTGTLGAGGEPEQAQPTLAQSAVFVNPSAREHMASSSDSECHNS